jgi:hypothetical protein
MRAIDELNKMVSRDEAQSVSIDIGHKLFLRARSEGRPGLVQQYSHFLRRLPKNILIIQSIEEDLDHSDKLTDYQLLLELSYISRHDKSEFNRYFEERVYEHIPKLLRDMLGDEEVVKEKRLKYVGACVDGLLASTAKPSEMDQDSPYRKLLLEEESGFVEYVTMRDNEYREKGLPVALVYLMGEMASASFTDLLLNEYKRSESFRVAISLGACIGPHRIGQLKNDLSDKQIESLMDVILNTGKIETSTKGVSDALNRWQKEYLDIRKRCQQRSRPQLG